MKKVLIFSAAALVTLLVGWWAGDLLGLLPPVKRAPGDDVHGSGGTRAAPPRTGPRLQGSAEEAMAASPADAAPFGVVRGQVVDLAGRPVAGARIWVGSTRAPRWVASMYLGEHHTTSDADGHFEFAPPESADRVRAAANGYVSDAEVWLGGSARVVLVLRRTDAVVEGTLRDTEGTAVANALVNVSSPYGTQPASTGRSDAEGRFSVPFVTGSSTYVLAWAPGFLEAVVEAPAFDAEGRATVDLVLRPGYWIEGHVVDATSEAGIAGAVLSSYERFGPVPTADSTGRFRYRATREINEITATADGYEAGSTRLAFADGTANARLALVPMTAHEFHGVVVDTDEAPVADAEVLTADARTRSDENGRFRLRCWLKRAAPAGFLVARAGKATPAVLRGPGSGEPITLQLGDAAPVDGKVILESGEPAHGASVRVVPAEGEATDPTWAILKALGVAGPYGVGADGAFRLNGLPQGRYELEASAGRTQNAGTAKAVIEVVPGRPLAGIEIRMPAGRVLRGRVVDAEGRGVPFANLSTYGAASYRSVSADEEGRFRIPALPAATITLHVKSPGYRLWTGNFTVGEEERTITLRRCVRLLFRLQGDDVPPSGSWAMVWFRESGQSGWSGAGCSVMSGAVAFDLMHGGAPREYVLKGDGWQTDPVDVEFIPGRWEVEIPVEVIPAPVVPHTQWLDTDPARRAPGASEESAASTTPLETGTIHGRVLGRAGDFGGTWVRARGDPRSKIVRVGDTDHTVDDTPTHQAAVSADGHFRLDRIPAGTWTLTGWRSSRHENEIDVTITANQIVELNDLRVPDRGPSIRGVVLDAEERPVSELEVRATPLRPEARSGRTKTRTDGTFELDDLEAGSYELRASDERGQVEPRTILAPSGDVVLHFQANGLLRGNVSGPWGEEDLPQGKVFIGGVPEGTFSTSASLQRNGSEFYFERRLPPGGYRVAVRVGDYVSPAGAAATLRPGEATPFLDLVLVRGCDVAVLLVDADGTRQTGGHFDLPPEWNLWPHIEPDPEGIFHFACIPPGTWVLKARGRAGYGRIDLMLVAGGSVRHEVVLRK